MIPYGISGHSVSVLLLQTVIASLCIVIGDWTGWKTPSLAGAPADCNPGREFADDFGY